MRPPKKEKRNIEGQSEVSFRNFMFVFSFNIWEHYRRGGDEGKRERNLMIFFFQNQNVFSVCDTYTAVLTSKWLFAVC